MTSTLNSFPSSLTDIAFADFNRLAAHISVDHLRGKKILITGATGFFGAWLLSLLDWINRTQGSDIEVMAVSRQPSAFLRRHPHFNTASWLRWIEGDVRDFAVPQHSSDYILHAATDTSAAAGRNPGRLLATIVEGTKHVLACAQQTNASRILLVSSGAVYGAQPAHLTHMPETTTTAPNPLLLGHAYGEGKRMLELLGAIYAAESKSSVVMARCFAFVGAGLPLDGHFAIGNFIRDALGKDQITIKSSGTAERSYLYAADLAIWLLRLLTMGNSGQAYNVGSDQALTIAQLAERVVAVLAPDKRVIVEGKDEPNAIRNRYIPSIDKARSECGLDVWTPLEQAIRLTAAYRF